MKIIVRICGGLAMATIVHFLIKFYDIQTALVTVGFMIGVLQERIGEKK